MRLLICADHRSDRYRLNGRFSPFLLAAGRGIVLRVLLDEDG